MAPRQHGSLGSRQKCFDGTVHVVLIGCTASTCAIPWKPSSNETARLALPTAVFGLLPRDMTREAKLATIAVCDLLDAWNYV